MRSIQVYRALDKVSNRFALCQTISQCVRLMHKSGNSMESSVTSALAGVGEKAYSVAIKAVPLRVHHDASPGLLFYPADVS